MRTFNKASVMVMGKFNGIYEWGDGWISGKKEKWDEYLSNLKNSHWKYFRLNEPTHSTDYLIAIDNVIFLHPLSFSAVMTYIPGMSIYDKADVDELYNICKELAEYCGGTFTMEVSKWEKVSYKFE